MKSTIVATTIVCALALAGCASSGGGAPPRTTCTPPAGGRCPGPEPVGTAPGTPLRLGADGRTISGSFLCGGKLTASETSQQVVLTYVAARVRAGGMQCAKVPLAIRLDTPVGSRKVVDGVTGRVLRIRTTK